MLFEYRSPPRSTLVRYLLPGLIKQQMALRRPVVPATYLTGRHRRLLPPFSACSSQADWIYQQAYWFHHRLRRR